MTGRVIPGSFPFIPTIYPPQTTSNWAGPGLGFIESPMMGPCKLQRPSQMLASDCIQVKGSRERREMFQHPVHEPGQYAWTSHPRALIRSRWSSLLAQAWLSACQALVNATQTPEPRPRSRKCEVVIKKACWGRNLEIAHDS